MMTLIEAARREFFEKLVVDRVLTVDPQGIPSNADPRKSGKNTTILAQQNISAKIAAGIVSQLPVIVPSAPKLSGQTAGSKFEAAVKEFVEKVFLRLAHLRPGSWTLQHGGLHIADFDQYAHLKEISDIVEKNNALASMLGMDYVIKPDVLVYRRAEPDDVINDGKLLFNDDLATMASLRADHGAKKLLHASISCKWTFRSDRAQNSRSEALLMVRNRKGRVPHIAVVTAEPLPSRLASLALGTGDLDFLYHFALPELIAAVKATSDEEAMNLLQMMIDGKRLKDISDLPLDLAI